MYNDLGSKETVVQFPVYVDPCYCLKWTHLKFRNADNANA